MGIGNVHPNCDGQKFGANGDRLQERATYASFKAWLLVVEGLGVVPHPYYAQQFGTGDRPCRGLSNNESGHLFVVGD